MTEWNLWNAPARPHTREAENSLRPPGLDPGTKVDVRFRSGRHWRNTRTDNLWWFSGILYDDTIDAYRLADPDAPLTLGATR